ncbi:MAG: hypothetical protein HZB23_09475 [Deltaproteobacteria bacterium]|nr:hypothetical protein [Deltaproteobacteria bacterium]
MILYKNILNLFILPMYFFNIITSNIIPINNKELIFNDSQLKTTIAEMEKLIKSFDNNIKIMIQFTDSQYELDNDEKTNFLSYLNSKTFMLNPYNCGNSKSKTTMPILPTLTITIFEIQNKSYIKSLSIYYIRRNESDNIIDSLFFITKTRNCYEIRGKNARDFISDIFTIMGMTLNSMNHLGFSIIV